MAERPIIFSGPMVRAILAGNKTQTRRVLRKQPPEGSVIGMCGYSGGYSIQHEAGAACECKPYKIGYQPGDLLWVRETWNGTQGEGVAYKATQPEMDGEPWRSSMFMPRWASRIDLSVTDVRVQRVQEISDEDVIAEGFSEDTSPPHDGVRLSATGRRMGFQYAWDHLHAKHAERRWAANPWVVAITFERVE